MGDMLSQAEIDALLNGVNIEDEPKDTASDSVHEKTDLLTPEERDALGEIGNISMGTAATTLYALLGQKVNITTPRVEESNWEQISQMFAKPYVAVKVQYTEGLKGFNLLIIKEHDVKIITDLMMGGDGYGNIQGELTELQLSAISEAMNQMVGSSSTSLSSMFEKRVDISPPESNLINTGTDMEHIRIDDDSHYVLVLFYLKVGDLIDSEIMQVMPYNFAKELATNLLQHGQKATLPEEQAAASEPSAARQMSSAAIPQPQPQPQIQPQPQVQPQPHIQPQPQYQPTGQMPPSQNQYGQQFGYEIPQRQPQPQPAFSQNPVNVQPIQLQSFDEGLDNFDRNNIGLLMDVPLQISVELGRTTRKIREILEFGQGSIIELDKLAGEPVDILVNGKVIAKGEVVVIDESFGVRITDILHPSKRL
ncbi:MAG TPA: flagellar motor switch phosphatase FliY [Ruminiclostridium sp.]|nr:flagellar motor switch phosphatase FliY [Ruminiclostridium sp.]